MAGTESPKTVAVDKERLRALIADMLDVEPAVVRDDALFVEDLEADSLMALEILVALEKTYGLSLTEADLRRIDTLDSACRLIEDKLAARAGGAPA